MSYGNHPNLDLLLASAVPVLDPASKDAAAIRLLFGAVFLICLAILIVVVWLICKSLLDSRARGRHLPPQDFGRRRSEIVWGHPAGVDRPRAQSRVGEADRVRCGGRRRG